MKYFCGIDPGKKGSISIISPQRTVFKVIPTPMIKMKKKNDYDIPAMLDILKKYPNSFVLIERAQAMPGQGVVSMFSIGYGYGVWIALLTALGIPFVEIHPRVWTNKLLKGVPGEGKSRNYKAAKSLFPCWVTKYKYEREYCDSLLLAEYGRITYDTQNVQEGSNLSKT